MVANPNYQQMPYISRQLTAPTFDKFYTFYCAEHSNRINRVMHLTGTTLAISTLVAAAVQRDASLILAVPVIGYGFAWIGHFFFEVSQTVILHRYRHQLLSVLKSFKT